MDGQLDLSGGSSDISYQGLVHFYVKGGSDDTGWFFSETATSNNGKTL